MEMMSKRFSLSFGWMELLLLTSSSSKHVIYHIRNTTMNNVVGTVMCVGGGVGDRRRRFFFQLSLSHSVHRRRPPTPGTKTKTILDIGAQGG